jgi:ADP-ribose pyrophosphatase YjhB (NUDIX family)
MAIIDRSLVLVAGAIVFKKTRGGRKWFLVKLPDEDKWEIPKTAVRKGESSARAVIRMTGEQGGMTAKVIEEAGRAGGVTTINGKTLPQRHLYYLMRQVSEGEAIGFDEYVWLDYSKALRKISTKREQLMFKQARKEFNNWLKERKKKKEKKK